MDMLQIADNLAEELEELKFSLPVSYVYNPLIYARAAHTLYIERYGKGPKEVVFIGMNPGPWGMAQTGVPFGEIGMVRGWLGIEHEVGKPPIEHPKKKVEGFTCRRSEVSGRRLWGLFRSYFESPERFFARYFVLNYCPLLFLDEEGRNLTPERLKQAERELLQAACDKALRLSINCLKPELVIGIGNFAARRAEIALAGLSIPIGQILHPSPSNPSANRNWEGTVLSQLKAQGVDLTA